MKNTIEKFRKLKLSHCDAMQALNDRMKKENRDFTEAENLEFELHKAMANDLSSLINLALDEQFGPAAPTEEEAAPLGRNRFGQPYWTDGQTFLH